MNTATFTVSDDKKTLVVKRAFEAPVAKVWQAWTTQSLLEQWWAPKPWRAVTNSFDFRAGGHWHYAMTGPDGEQHWGWMDYHTIDREKMFEGNDKFCDETGATDTNLPEAHWKNEFKLDGSKTLVTMTTIYSSADDLEKVMQMGMKEGLSTALDQLESVISNYS